MFNQNRVVHYVKWKQLINFPEYFISNAGAIRHEKTICTPLSNEGKCYDFIVCIHKDIDVSKNKRHHFDIHRLVWNYFGSEPHKKGFEIHHIDLNFRNNHIDNLKLITVKEHKEFHVRLRQLKKAA